MQVPRCAGLHFAELTIFKGRSTQCSTMLHIIGTAGLARLPLRCLFRLIVGRARLGIEVEVARDNKNITECSILENIFRIILQSAQSSYRPSLAARQT